MQGRDEMTGTPEEALLQRARRGEEQAFVALFRRYEGALRRQVLGMLSPAILRKISVADLVQETRIVALRRLDTFEYRGEGSFGNWIRRIADNKARSVVQQFAGTAKRATSRELTRGQRQATGAFVATDLSPSEAAMRAETAQQVHEAMAELPDHHREVLRMATRERRTLREIAEHLGRSRESVKKTYGRAMARFTEILQRRMGGPGA